MTGHIQVKNLILAVIVESNLKLWVLKIVMNVFTPMSNFLDVNFVIWNLLNPKWEKTMKGLIHLANLMSNKVFYHTLKNFELSKYPKIVTICSSFFKKFVPSLLNSCIYKSKILVKFFLLIENIVFMPTVTIWNKK